MGNEALASRQLSLPEIREPLIYLSPGSTGYFSLLVKEPERMRQTSHPMKEINTILRCVPRDRDTYITPNQYIRKNRRLVNLWQLNAIFADLDCYKIPTFDGLSPEQLTFQCLDMCMSEGIPIPSLILSSGRGLQVKWILHKPLPRQALPRWNAVQRVITSKLEKLGADQNSIDGSRVLRLEQTVNTKVGQVVKVLWPDNWTRPVTYDFELLSKEVLPLPRNGSDLYRTNVKRIWRALERQIRFTQQTLNWARLEDIRRLAYLRGWTQGNPDGSRDSFIFSGIVFGSWIAKGLFLFQEGFALAKEFAPAWPRPKILNKVGYYVRGVEHGRRLRFTNQRLIEWLEITPEEEHSLKTIISKGEKANRRRTRLKNITRAEYEAKAKERRLKAIELKQTGKSYRQIAEQLGVTVRHAIRLIEEK